jgi:hypothetical protein
MAYALLISTEDVKKFTIANGNLDADDFIEYIKISQDITIQNYLGTQLYKKLQDLILSDEINNEEFEDYRSLLVTYIKPMLVHWAMVYYLPFAAYTLSNKGLFKHSSESATNVDKAEVDYLVEKERDIAESYTQRFIDFMCFNQSTYPEYNSNSNEDVNPDTNNFYGGWFLG